MATADRLCPSRVGFSTLDAHDGAQIVVADQELVESLDRRFNEFRTEFRNEIGSGRTYMFRAPWMAL